MIKIAFFTGVPVDDAATLYRSGLVAKKLIGKDYQVIFTSVLGNFKKREVKEVSDLPVLFIGQAHYLAQRPFSSRQRLGIAKSLMENIKTCFRFAKMLRQEKPDRVLVVTTMPVSLMVGLVTKVLGFQAFIDVEDLVIGQMEASGYPRWLIFLYSKIEKLAILFFNRVCVCSHYLKEQYPRSVLIPNMIETKFWQNDGDLRFKNKDLRIVFVGQMGPYHGQREVLEGLAPLLAKRKDLKLTFVGGGERLQDLRFKIDDLGLNKQVIITGQVSQEKVREILASSYIGILPLWDTPVHQARHPLKLLEYLAAGLVVMTNAVGEAELIIKDGENGFLSPAGNLQDMVKKIKTLIDNPQESLAISRQARKTASQFETSKIYPKWVDFLK